LAHTEKPSVSLKTVLKFACVKNPETGSATAVVGVLDKNILRTVNLGDSGYVLFRPRQDNPKKLDLVFRSEE